MLEVERANESHDRVCIESGGEQILFLPPGPGWHRPAMVGQIEGDHTPPRRDLRVAEQLPVLSGVGTRRVQAHQRPTYASFLEVEAGATPCSSIEVYVAPRNRVELRHDSHPSGARFRRVSPGRAGG